MFSVLLFSIFMVLFFNDSLMDCMARILYTLHFGLPCLLIELFYIGMPVVRTDGRSLGVRSRDYHISLAMGLRPRAANCAARGAPL